MGTYGLYFVSGVGYSHYDPLGYTRLGLVFAAITVFALHGYGAYSTDLGLLRIDAVRKILRGVFAGVLLTLGISFLARFPNFSRITVLLLGPVTVFALAAQRSLIWRLRDRARARQPDMRGVVIYGAGETGRLLAQLLATDHQLGLNPLGFLDDDPLLRGKEVKVGPGIEGHQLPVLGDEESIEQVVEMTGASAVFLATPSAPSQRITHLITQLESSGIPFFFVPSAGDLLLSSMRLGRVAGLPVLTRRTPNRARFYRTPKRAMDLLGATVALILTAPILALAALLVRLSSPGPVLFTQTRAGLNGKPFTIYKLRTMRQESPQYALHPKSAADSRVTWAGRWLRRLSIDELPQLYNVLKGEMSLVGPRPEMPFVVSGYNDAQRQRLTVKPGMTGLWQISADRAFLIHDNIHYDLYYVEQCSTTLDIAILIITPFVLLASNRAM